jgi:hypothetical protein
VSVLCNPMVNIIYRVYSGVQTQSNELTRGTTELVQQSAKETEKFFTRVYISKTVIQPSKHT